MAEVPASSFLAFWFSRLCFSWGRAKRHEICPTIPVTTSISASRASYRSSTRVDRHQAPAKSNLELYGSWLLGSRGVGRGLQSYVEHIVTRVELVQLFRNTASSSVAITAIGILSCNHVQIQGSSPYRGNAYNASRTCQSLASTFGHGGNYVNPLQKTVSHL